MRFFARALELAKSTGDYIVGFVAALVPLIYSAFLTIVYLLYEWRVDNWDGLGQFVAGFTIGLAVRFGITFINPQVQLVQ